MPEYFVPNPPSTINDVQLREEVQETFPGALLNLQSSGIMRVITVNTLDTSEQATLATIIENHQAVDWDAIASQAEQDFSNLPGWADWTIQQAEDWHNTNIHDEITESIATVNQLVIDAGNITNLATALPVVQGMVAEMAHMLSIMQKLSVEGREEGVGILSIRNKLFPHLQNGSS